MAGVNLSGNATRKVSSNAISDFVILKAFNSNLHPQNAHVIKEIMWQPPIFDWIKCNFDSASGAIFRNYQANHLGSFDFNINNGNSLLAELTCAVIAIETASDKNGRKLWLVPDSKPVVLGFSASSIVVPWQLRKRWTNCLNLIMSMEFMVTHIFREGNHYADKLANIGDY
jgi:ribonuclease HI